MRVNRGNLSISEFQYSARSILKYPGIRIDSESILYCKELILYHYIWQKSKKELILDSQESESTQPYSNSAIHSI